MTADLPSSTTYVRALDKPDPSITVLCVGDESARAVFRDGLETHAPDLTVLGATGVDTALERLRESDVGCVISTVGPVESSGTDTGSGDLGLLGHVREMDRDLPFVLLAEDGSGVVSAEVVNAGVDGYVEYDDRPGEATFETLVERLRTVVADYRERQRLEETTDLLFRLTEYTNDTLWMFTADWSETVVVNDAYETVWDRSKDDLVDDPADFLAGIHPEDRDIVREKMEVLSGGEPADLEYRIQTDDGDRYMAVHAEPVFDDDGEVAYVAGFTRDITDLHDRERELERQRTELERSNESLKQFAYVASHDLQEPLRMVSSYVSLLDAEYGDDLEGDAERYIEYAVDGATRMQAMIDALLQYSRVQTQGEEFAAVDPDEVLDDTLRSLELLVDEESATVERGDLPTVSVDRDQFGQLLQNLLKNAVQHATPEPTVTVEATRERDWAHFTVADDGPGIENSQQDRIFEIFNFCRGGVPFLKEQRSERSERVAQ